MSTTTEKRNVISVTGGKVHRPHTGFAEGDTAPWPECRTYGGNTVHSRYTRTDLTVTCSHCCEQDRRHEAAAARLERDTAAHAEAEAAQVAGNVTNGGMVHLAHAGYGGTVEAWPFCRGYQGTAQTFRHTALAVSCSLCATEVRCRQIAAAGKVERAEAAARLGAPVRADRPVPAVLCHLATAAAAARYPGIVKAGEMWITTAGGTATARVTLAFPNLAGHGRDRRAAAETVARLFSVRLERSRIMNDDYAGRYPYGAQPWEYGARDLTVIGSPGNVARYVIALPGILVDLELIATRAAKAYGTFLRTSSVVDDEMMPSAHRSALRAWRREAFDEAAYIAGHRPSAKTYSPDQTMSTQARAYVHTLATLPDLYTYADEAAVAAAVAAARHEAPPSIADTAEAMRHHRITAAALDALDEVYAPAEFGPMPLDEAYVPPTCAPLDEVEALEVAAETEAAVLTAAAAILDALDVDQAAPALPAARKDHGLDARPATRRRPAARPAHHRPAPHHLGRGRGAATRRPVARAPLGEVRVLRGPAGRTGLADAPHGARRGGGAARPRRDARALGGRRGAVRGTHPGPVRAAAVLAGRPVRRAVVLAL